MGKRETHICDVCKIEVGFTPGGAPKLRAADVRIQLYKQNWGDPEYLVGWKGELCDGCVAIINRAAEAFWRELHQREEPRQPGDRPSTPEAQAKKPKGSRKPKPRKS